MLENGGESTPAEDTACARPWRIVLRLENKRARIGDEPLLRHHGDFLIYSDKLIVTSHLFLLSYIPLAQFRNNGTSVGKCRQVCCPPRVRLHPGSSFLCSPSISSDAFLMHMLCLTPFFLTVFSSYWGLNPGLAYATKCSTTKLHLQPFQSFNPDLKVSNFFLCGLRVLKKCPIVGDKRTSYFYKIQCLFSQNQPCFPDVTSVPTFPFSFNQIHFSWNSAVQLLSLKAEGTLRMFITSNKYTAGHTSGLW